MAQSRLKAERERDRRNISRMYLQGRLQAEIAVELNISQPTVSRDLAYIQKQWAVERLDDFVEKKNIELAKVDNLELEYWEAWKRSQKDAEMRIKKAVEAGGETRKEAQERIEGQVGDPRFLAGVQWCINKRCEILGLDAPKKQDFTSGGDKITVVPLNVRLDDV